MGQHMKNRDHKGSDSTGHDHEANLTNGGKRQHAFNIHLSQGDKGCKKCGHTSDQCNDRHGFGRKNHERTHANQQEGSGIHHGRGMNQRRNRCGRFHGKGKPDMERHLCGLPHGSQEKKKRNERKDMNGYVQPEPAEQVDAVFLYGWGLP